MGIGSNVKKQVEKVITQLGSSVVFARIDETFNIYGDVTNVVAGTGTAYGVPSKQVSSRLSLRSEGNLQEGEIRMLFVAGTALDALKGTAYRIYYNNGTYIPREESVISVQNVDIAQPIILVEDK